MKNMLFIVFLFLAACVPTKTVAPTDSSGFVVANEVVPSIVYDIRYFTDNNFLGVKVDGYHAPKCYLTKQAASALNKAQQETQAVGFSLKIFDCYRPQRAVDHFARWARDTKDVKTKQQYYPNLAKDTLFPKGYIAEKSGHSRGSTVDLTLVDRAGKELDMGTPFDFFDTLSNTADPRVTGEQSRNRIQLKSLMEKHGFVNLAEEWWHYTFQPEPFPDTYFSFNVD